MPSRSSLPVAIFATALACAQALPAVAAGDGPSPLVRAAKDNPPLVFPRISSNLLIDGKLATADARDVFRLTLKDGEGVIITMRSKDLDSLLEVYSEADEAAAVASDDDGGGGRDAELRFMRAPGSKSGAFFVVAKSVSGAGVYTLELRKRELPPPPPPVKVALNTKTAGRIDTRSPWTNTDKQSYQAFAFEAKAGERLRIAATPDRVGDDLSLQLSNGGKDIVSNSSATIIRKLDAEGTYEVRVVSSADKTDFTLSVDRLPQANLVAAAEPVIAGTPVHGRFGPNSAVLTETSNRPYALYKLDGKAGQRFRASVTVDGDFKAVAGKGEDDAKPLPRLTLQVGVESAAGFATVASAPPPPFTQRPASFAFQRDGTLLIQVFGPAGIEAGYTLKVEVPPPPASAPAPASKP